MLPADYHKIPQLNCTLIMFIYLYFSHKIRPKKTNNERNGKDEEKSLLCDFTTFLFFPYNWNNKVEFEMFIFFFGKRRY